MKGKRALTKVPFFYLAIEVKPLVVRADSREFPTGNSREFPEKNENRKFPGIFQISREFSGNFYNTVGPNFDENLGKFEFCSRFLEFFTF